MSLKTIVAAAIIVGAAIPASAQSPKVEISAIFGWTLSDGVSGDAILAQDGNLYNRIDPKDSLNWGLSVAVPLPENYEVGFLYGKQMSTLEIGNDVSSTITKDLGDIAIDTYHVYFGYNAFPADAKVRPYAMFGLGATNFGSVEATRFNGQIVEIGGNTQFSTTWGAGVKVYAGPNVGARFGVRWTPTYIKSDAAGYWCDPYWGCYVVGNAQYSNQFDFSGGIMLRF